MTDKKPPWHDIEPEDQFEGELIYYSDKHEIRDLDKLKALRKRIRSHSQPDRYAYYDQYFANRIDMIEEVKYGKQGVKGGIDI